MEPGLSIMVEGCALCPFSYMAYGAILCQHPAAPNHNNLTEDEMNNALGLPAPEWCPLRTEEVNIAYVGK